MAFMLKQNKLAYSSHSPVPLMPEVLVEFDRLLITATFFIYNIMLPY